MKIKSVLLASVLGALAMIPAAANAAVYTTDFATIGSQTGFTGPYSDGGITVEYIGAGSIWTTSQPTAPSGYSWYSNGGGTGYTDIILTGGGTFTSASLLVGSGWYGGGAELTYQLLNGATVVSTGDWGALPAYGSGLITANFSGGPFTEIRVQGPQSSTFDPSNYEALAIGSITLSAVPETSTWVMMLAGFAGLGFLGARRSKAATLAA
jgi:hypothetical protein